MGHGMRRFWLLIGLSAVLGACVAAKEYLEDWQSMELPSEESQVITVPAFPEAGRTFKIHRTFTTKRSKWAKRRTPPEGYDELLKVADSEGTLEFWRDGKLIHAIQLGPCLSFAKMDRNHDFAKQGSPAYFTAPSDCRVWDGREWHQTYRTLVVGWHNPCVYEAKRRAYFMGDGDGLRVRTSTDIEMTVEKNWRTNSWSSVVEYDPELQFFRMFNVGYVGRVEVLEEVKEGDAGTS